MHVYQKRQTLINMSLQSNTSERLSQMTFGSPDIFVRLSELEQIKYIHVTKSNLVTTAACMDILELQ